MSEILDHLRRTVLLPDEASLSDEQLLDRLLHRRDQAALAALVRRHGSMVWGVCRRVLGSHQDAEDAFQATFLVLVRKATSIRCPSLFANWLYGVAYQTARKARATLAKRRIREKQVTEMPEPAAIEEQRWQDLQPLLDQELSLLPDKYRSVIVLCDLEGKTRKEVARQLGCPEGTVAGRLARARTMLAKRLTRYGLSSSGAALAVLLSQETSAAAVPNSVIFSTIKVASVAASGKTLAAGVIPAKVATLTEGVLKTMLLTKLKVMTAVLVTVGLIGLSATLLNHRTLAARAADVDQQEDLQTRTNESVRGSGGPAKQESRRLTGAWAVRHIETNGEAVLDENNLKEARITFKEDRAEVTGLQLLFVGDFSFKLDPSSSSRAIDVTFLAGPKKGETFKGVYVLRGDEMRICLRLKHTELGRPAGFVTTSGTTLYTFVLRRAEVKNPPRENNAAVAAHPPAKGVGQACRVTGALTSTEYARVDGSLERAIVSVHALPGLRQVAHADVKGTRFTFDLAPGEYLLECTAIGSRGATFVPTKKKFTVKPKDRTLQIGEIDLPISEITRLFGKPAPELSGVVAWKNTKPLSLKRLKGKVVVLDFWGHYCSICLHHKPDLARLADKYKDKGLVVLTIHDSSAVTLEEVYQKLSATARRKVASLPVALDGKDGVFRAYGVRAVPTVILIGPDGKIVRRFHHAGDPELDAEVGRLLKTAK